ncbi:ABC transporter ATP-binding protein [Clostridiales bacterium COT073_COT-073]|nr:ABC transporter ATP-binding protein [Clostridiales bacterium COT073_COT-073]
MNSAYILETQNLTKKFEETIAINDLNLKLEYGKVYGLIGRNGAGKTTFLKLISNMLFPTSGQIKLNSEYLQKEGDIAFGRCYYIKYFTQKIGEIIKFASYSFPNWQQEYAEELIDSFELDVKKKYHRSSSGMQTMTSLIIALAANPQLLLLDEPYVGLDPINREVFYNFLRSHYFDGEKTVIISSHMIKEIEGYFEKAIMLNKGKLILHEDLDRLKQKSFMIQADSGLTEFIERNLHVIGKETLGQRSTFYIFDQIRDAELMEIQTRGGVVQTMDLQTFMVKILTKGEAI